MKTFRLVLFWFCWCLLFIPSATSLDFQSYHADYNIVLDKAIVEITVKFDKFHSQAEWVLPKDTTAIEVSDGLNFEVQELDNAQKVVVQGKLFNQVRLKYITGSVIEKTQERSFILDLSAVNASDLSVSVKLPEGAALKYTVDMPQPSFFPPTDDLSTDGQRIILRWDSTDLERAKRILIIYIPSEHTRPWLYGLIFAALMVLGGGIWYFFRKKKDRKKTVEHKAKGVVVPKKDRDSSDLTRNLFEEEKKVMEILLESKGNELWQKELAHKSGLSKVKLSRKIRNLEQKGLIEKIPYGNTNKIRIRK